MKKIADSPVQLMSEYVDHLRALVMVHQNNHWETSGNNFYGNHLLFQRLYEGVLELADEAAEKTIGVFDTIIQGDVSGIVKRYSVEKPAPSMVGPDAYIKSSLKAEDDFQTLARKVYLNLKDSSSLTLGLDDMIMSHSSRSEVHTYLLKQSLMDK